MINEQFIHMYRTVWVLNLCFNISITLPVQNVKVLPTIENVHATSHQKRFYFVCYGAYT